MEPYFNVNYFQRKLLASNSIWSNILLLFLVKYIPFICDLCCVFHLSSCHCRHLSCLSEGPGQFCLSDHCTLHTAHWTLDTADCISRTTQCISPTAHKTLFNYLSCLCQQVCNKQILDGLCSYGVVSVCDKYDLNVLIQIQIHSAGFFFANMNTNIFWINFLEQYKSKYIQAYPKRVNINVNTNIWTVIGKYRYQYNYLLHTIPSIKFVIV